MRILKQRLELAVVVSLGAVAACVAPSQGATPDKTGTTTTVQNVGIPPQASPAQRASDFLVPAAVTYTQGSSCLSCIQPDVLVATSIAAQLLTDLTVDTSASTGTGYIANLIVSAQQPSGRWTSGGAEPQSTSAELLWALAGFAGAGTTGGLENVRQGLLWAAPLSSTTTFPADGGPYGGQSRTFFDSDFTSAPQMFDWYLPTAQAVFATRVLLDLDPNVASSEITTLSAQQTSFADAMEGTTMRALTTTTLQHLALTALAMADSGRASSADAQAIGNQILAEQLTDSSGWSDPTSPDATLGTVNSLSTAQALYALCRLGIRPRTNVAASAGLDWLMSQQQDDGSWALQDQDATVGTSWALLTIACVTNPSGTADFQPLTDNGNPGAADPQTFATMLNIINTASDARTASITVTGGPSGTVVTASPSTLNLAGDASGAVSISVVLPSGLPTNTAYPFVATVTFTDVDGDSAQALAKYTVAIGAASDPMPDATTTWSPPPRANVGSSIALLATVADSNGQNVEVGTLQYALDGQSIMTVPYSKANAGFSGTWFIAGVTVGHHTLSAAYSGSAAGGDFTVSSATKDIYIAAASPSRASVGNANADNADPGGAPSLDALGGCSLGARPIRGGSLAPFAALGLVIAARRRRSHR